MTPVQQEIFQQFGEIAKVLARIERNLDETLVIANRMSWELADAGLLPFGLKSVEASVIARSD